MIETDIAAFLQSRVMILVSTVGADGRPTIGRGTGAVFDSLSGKIDLLVSAGQWPDVARHAVPGVHVATTYVRPNDYRAIQIKGVINEVAPAGEEGRRRGARYVAEMLETMASFGISRVQLSSTLCDRELMHIRFWPTDLFQQTPGPKAGQRLPLMEA